MPIWQYRQSVTCPKKKWKKQFLLLGFEKAIFSSRTCLKYAFYRRNAKNVFLNQIEECDDENKIVSVGNRTSLLHPPETQLGTNGCMTLEHAIKFSKDSSVCWTEMQTDGVTFIVGCLKLFSDKSHTALSAGPLQLYPFRVFFLNFNSAYRHMTIAHEETVVAYVLVLNDRVESWKPIESTKS